MNFKSIKFITNRNDSGRDNLQGGVNGMNGVFF